MKKITGFEFTHTSTFPPPNPPPPHHPPLHSYNSYRLNKNETLQQICREHDESFPLQLSKFQLCDKGITVLYFYVKVFYFQKLLKLHHKSWCIYKDMRYLIGRVSWHNYTTAKAEGKIKKKKASIQPSRLSLPTPNFIANLIYLTQGAISEFFFSFFFE